MGSNSDSQGERGDNKRSWQRWSVIWRCIPARRCVSERLTSLPLFSLIPNLLPARVCVCVCVLVLQSCSAAWADYLPFPCRLFTFYRDNCASSFSSHLSSSHRANETPTQQLLLGTFVVVLWARVHFRWQNNFNLRVTCIFMIWGQ